MNFLLIVFSLALIGHRLITRDLSSINYFDCMIVIGENDAKCIILITKSINSVRSVYRLFLTQRSIEFNKNLSDPLAPAKTG
jgi:hypothetical protein